MSFFSSVMGQVVSAVLGPAAGIVEVLTEASPTPATEAPNTPSLTPPPFAHDQIDSLKLATGLDTSENVMPMPPPPVKEAKAGPVAHAPAPNKTPVTAPSIPEYDGAEQIVAAAKSFAEDFQDVELKDPKRQELLKQVYQVAGIKINDYQAQQIQPAGVSWCGMFATHVLQSAGAFDGKWVPGIGPDPKAARPLHQESSWDPKWRGHRQDFKAAIRPGDFVVLSGDFGHRVIVTDVRVDEKGHRILTTVAGNAGKWGGAIKEQTYDAGRVISIYRGVNRP